MRARLRSPLPYSVLALALATLTGCGGSDDPLGPGGDPGPGAPQVPGPGPHFSVSPLDLDQLARIVPIGSNGKIFPIGHTYWRTCDLEFFLPTTAPCVRERLPVRAPGDGVVIRLEQEDDGEIVIEGPPGLRAGFAHVTPSAGLSVGDSVQAGGTIAVMFADHVFDFQLTNLGIEPHTWVRAERYANLESYRYAQNPIAQFPEPLRSELLSRVSTRSDPMGRLSYDVEGTAAGNWFLPGVPLSETMNPIHAPRYLFLGRLLEREETRVLTKGGEDWYPIGQGVAVVDPGDPSWDELTPADGPVQLRLWGPGRDAGPRLDQPFGSVLIEVLSGEGLRIEWFDTHDPVEAFTPGALVYER